MTDPNLVPVYEWLFADGTVMGCGTALEFWYWSREGTVAEGSRCGKIICHEPAKEDARRCRAWGLDGADLPDDHPLVQPAPGPSLSMGSAIRRELEPY